MPQPPPALVLPFVPALPMFTSRLILRGFAEADFAPLLAFQSVPAVVRFVPYEPRTLESMRTALDVKLAGTSLRQEGDHLDIAVTTLEDQLVGDLILILRSERDLTVEIGYVFDPRHGGLGYATEAVQALLGIAFSQLGVRRVVARVDERNAPSRRVCERLGMRQEALMLENEWFKGEWINEVDYGLLAREWLPRGSVSCVT